MLMKINAAPPTQARSLALSLSLSRVLYALIMAAVSAKHLKTPVTAAEGDDAVGAFFSFFFF